MHLVTGIHFPDGLLILPRSMITDARNLWKPNLTDDLSQLIPAVFAAFFLGKHGIIPSDSFFIFPTLHHNARTP